jgi:Stage II sporulation protein M
MDAQNFALVQGMRDTKATLAGWNDDPGPVLKSWLAGALLITVALLLSVWAVAALSTPDATRLRLPGISRPATLDDALFVLGRNSLVLALHAMACVAGFIAGSSLRHEAERYHGVWRWVHEKAGPLAIAFVIGATSFSLLTQAYVLGGGAATLSSQLGLSIPVLLLALLPHALPELVALFLPLAAWIIASRRDDWHELLAATFVTVAIALPILVVSALVEVFVTPHILLALSS